MRRIFAAAGAAFMLAAAPAGAAPTWVPTGALDGTPDLAAGLGADGDALVAWLRGGALEARVRAPGGPFTPAQALASEVSAVDVAVTADGTALLAWARPDGIYGAVWPRGGTLVAQRLSDSPPGEFELSVNARGDALLAFALGGVWTASRPAGGAFEGPVAVKSGGAACRVQAAVGDAGHAAVAWQDVCGGATQVARRAPSGPWGGPAALAAAPAIDLAVTSAGHTGVLMQGSQASIAAADGGFTPSGPATGASGTIAAGGADLVAAWISGGYVEAARSTAGGGFAELGRISPAGATAAWGGAGADGRATVVWTRESGTLLEAAHAPAGGTFTTHPHGTVGGAPAVAVDTDGNALAAIAEAGTPAYVLDAAGPRLTLDARTAGFAEQAYPFSIAASDAWSSVASTAFDFGDGTAAPGPSAQHAYASPGVRTITASGTDAFGNASAVSASIEVLPAQDRTPPKLTRVRMDAKRFRISSKPTPVAIVAAVRRGTRFRYTLSEPATANILFERVTTGRKAKGKGKRCSARRRKGRKCKLYAPVGLITRQHPVAGPVSVGFTGRIVAGDGPIAVAEARLKPGRYRATIIAGDANRNLSKPAYLSFRVVR